MATALLILSHLLSPLRMYVINNSCTQMSIFRLWVPLSSLVWLPWISYLDWLLRFQTTKHTSDHRLHRLPAPWTDFFFDLLQRSLAPEFLNCCSNTRTDPVHCTFQSPVVQVLQTLSGYGINNWQESWKNKNWLPFFKKS